MHVCVCVCVSLLCRFAQDGASLSINTDDPGIINTDLNEEYLVAEERLGLSMEQLIETVSGTGSGGERGGSEK